MNHEAFHPIQPELGTENAQFSSPNVPRVAVVGPGQNLISHSSRGHIESNPQHLSYRGKEESLAIADLALYLLQNGQDPTIVLTSGYTTKFSEADWMKKYILRHPKYAALRNRFILDEISRETTGNAQITTEKILAPGNFDRTVLVVPQPHENRVVKLFHAYGTDFDEIKTAEEIYINDPNISPESRARREAVINGYKNSLRGKLERAKEHILGFWLVFDRKGRIPKAIVGGFRSRISGVPTPTAPSFA